MSGQQNQAVVTDRKNKEQLEAEKLELEIADLKRRTGLERFVPYLPALFALLAVGIAYLTAWQTGVFESRNNALKAENALLEVKKIGYQTDIAKFQETKTTLDRDNENLRLANETVKSENQFLQDQKRRLEAQVVSAARLAEVSVFSGKLTAEHKVTSVAVDDLASVLARRDEHQVERIASLQSILEKERDPTNQALISYSLYLGTRDKLWRARLFDILRTNGKSLDDVKSSAFADVFGDQRWPDADRLDLVIELMKMVDGKDSTPIRQGQLLRQIGTVHLGARFNYHTSRKWTTSFRLDNKAPDVFLRAVIVARSLAVEHGSSEALVALSRFAPPAMIAVGASIMNRTDLSKGVPQGPIAGLQDGVDYANENVDFRLRGPGSPQPHERFFDEYHASTAALWRRWATANAEAYALWMEPNLDTLRRDMRKYLNMFEFQY